MYIRRGSGAKSRGDCYGEEHRRTRRAEVVQLYIHDGHSPIDRPEHELKGFRRVELKPGESKQVEFWLGRQDFSYWSPEKKGWVADPGAFEVQVGGSSRSIELREPPGAEVGKEIAGGDGTQPGQAESLPRRLVRLNAQHVAKHPALIRRELILVAAGIEHG